MSFLRRFDGEGVLVDKQGQAGGGAPFGGEAAVDRVAVRAKRSDARAVCSAEDLALSTLLLWRRKLGRSGQRFEGRGAAAFVESADAPTASPVWKVELELGEGVFLRLRRPSRC